MNIEKDVPVPPIVRSRPIGHNRALLADMEPGDSVFLEGKDVSRAWSTFYNPAKRLGYKITIRSVPGGCRMWRVS